MGAFYDEIPDNHLEWIKEQKMFFVATAPLSAKHHVNVSPKGHDTLRVVSSTACWYLDLTGSGNETISHVRENGRITIMFAAITGGPRIMRLFGRAKVFLRDSPDFDRLLQPDDPRRLPGHRAIIWIDIHKVGTSCGFSVPFFDYREERMTLVNRAADREKADLEGRSTQGLKQYWSTNNAESMDGLQGLEVHSDRLRFASRRTQDWRLFAIGTAVGGLAVWTATGGIPPLAAHARALVGM